MLSNASSIETVLPQFLDFVEGDILIGHNVNFDINFIYDNKIKIDEMPFKNDYLDTLRLSKKALQDLSHHRLTDIAKYYSVSYEKQHRAMEDCKVTYACYLQLKKQ